MPGQTNRVKLLIGNGYAVTSSSPISIVSVSDSAMVVSNRTETSFYIRRPVTLSFVPYSPTLLMSGSGQSQGTTLCVEPANLMGTYVLEQNMCCMRILSDGTPLFCCDGQCGCGGCSTGGIRYEYEGYSLTFGQFSCGCTYEDQEADDEPELPATGGVSASFDKKAIIFEDRYETSPGVFVERQSTSSRLNVRVKGGTHGGTYSVSIANSSKLVFKGGTQLPVSRYVEPGECFRFYSEFEASCASSSVGDIIVTASFDSAEDDTSQVRVTDAITAVALEVRVEAEAPENSCENRHKFAIGERFKVSKRPANVAATYNMNLEGNYFSCPLNATNDMLAVNVSGVSYIPHLEVVEPVDMIGVGEECVGFSVSSNRPGWVGLSQYYSLCPADVNFYGIKIKEIPSFDGTHSGYFDNIAFSNDWYHLENQGAGVWMEMSMTNVAKVVDLASSRREFLRVKPNGDFTNDENYQWADGQISWMIPIGWSRIDSSTNAPVAGIFNRSIEQRFTITRSGRFSIEKLGNVAERDIDGRFYLNGVETDVE